MSWLHSPFTTTHQILGDNASSNLRKGYSVGTSDKDGDVDKSETPLLCSSSVSKGSNVSSDDWFKNAPGKKPSLLQSIAASKPNFLPSGLFERSHSNASAKPKSAPLIREPASKPKDRDKSIVVEKRQDDEDESESEDEWGLPNFGGYHKVKLEGD